MSKKIKHKNRSVVFIFLVVYSVFVHQSISFFCLKTISVVSSIHHSESGIKLNLVPK